MAACGIVDVVVEVVYLAARTIVVMWQASAKSQHESRLFTTRCLFEIRYSHFLLVVAIRVQIAHSGSRQQARPGKHLKLIAAEAAVHVAARK